jgi:uncharacterized membrane protein YdbT with pleckstrin-like domain
MLGNEWLDIGANERKKIHTHPSKWMLLKQLLASALMIGLIIGISLQDFATEVQIGQMQVRTILLLGIPIALLLPIAAQIQRLSTHYVITDRNIWAKEKIYARDVDPTVRSRVIDVNYTQSGFDRLLNKGDVKIETGGTGGVDTVLRDIPNPKGVAALIRKGIENDDELYQDRKL